MRIDVVDPSAFTPPYDRALATALARVGEDITLVTSRFAYGDVPAAAGFAVDERFYRLAVGGPGSKTRLAAKLAEHVPEMVAYSLGASRRADVVHFQWLTVQPLDVHLLPRRVPTVLTAHDVLPREPRPGQLRAQRRLYERVDHVIVHSAHGAARLAALGLDPAKVTVIPHGAFTHLTPGALPPELAETDPATPVVVLPGLLRPYKGLDLLLEAWHDLPGELCPRCRLASSSSRASSPTASWPPSSRAPTSSRCPTARSTSPASSTPPSASAGRCC
jgi:glycosyltransferase involved in cell wall biosynthesis